MNNYPEMKCPKCGGIIELGEIYDNEIGEDFFINLCIGHCVKCDSYYQWYEEFEKKFKCITDFEEVD